MNRLRKLLTASVLSATLLTMTGVSFAGATAADGTLVKQNGNPAVYYYKGGKRYVFPNEATYKSWYADFNSVQTISKSELESYPLGGNVTMRPGTKLVKITTSPTVYAVEPGGVLRAIPSEAAAIDLYGANWAKTVVDVSDAFFTNYTTGTALAAGVYPVGQVVNPTGTSDLYYWDGTNYRKFSSEAAYLANGYDFNSNYIVTTAKTITGGGTGITGAETTLVNVAGGAGTGQTAIVGGSGLTVAMASDTPAAATVIVSATPANGAQAFIPVGKFNFTASSDGAVQVNTLNFKRAGVPSADGDFADLYLYDGNTMIGKYNSFTSGVLTFSNTTTGLFTVPAGTTKAITLKVNMDKDAGSARNFNFGILAATDVVPATGVVSGSFPMISNTMNTASVTDLGQVTIAEVTGSAPTAPDPSVTSQTLWKFTAAVTNQDVQIERVKMSLIGTLATTDITDFKLMVGGVQVGATVASMNADKTITFDLATPYKIEKGNTKTIELMGTIVSGTSRTFQVYIYNKEDFVAKDLGYNVYLTPNQADTWTKIYSVTGGTINPGGLSISRNLTSPSGNVAKSATNVEIGKFDIKATGEAIKIDSVWAYADVSATSNNGLYQVKLYVDGAQVGTAVNLTDATETEIALGNALVIPAGVTKTLTVKADIKQKDGTAMTGDETIAFTLRGGTNAKSIDFSRQATGTTGTIGPVSANVLNVKTGLLTEAKNLSMPEYSTTNPIGVRGATNVKVGSFALTAGAGEAVNLTQVVVGDDNGDTTEDFGDNFQNLVLMHNGVAIAPMQNTLSGAAGADYTFNLNPAVVIPAGSQYVIDCYADILTSGTGFGGNAAPGLEYVSSSATGVSTNINAGDANVSNLQNVRIASSGTLTVGADSSTPVSRQLVMGQTDVEFAKLSFLAGASENINISRIKISDTTTGYNGSLYNIKLFDGTTQIGSTVASFNASNDAEFYLPTNWVIPKGTTKILTIKASVNAYPAATSGGTVTLALSSNANIDTIGADSGQVVSGASEVVSGATGKAQDIYRTKITVVKDASSPAGISTASGNAPILSFTATADSNYDAVLNAVALTMSGTVDVTGTADAHLYKSDDLNNALATEAYVAAKTGTSTTEGTTTTWLTSESMAGIPVGANVWANDADATATKVKITSIAVTGATSTVTFTPAITSFNGGVNSTMTYYPLEPGTGKLFFGAQTTLTADLADAATTVTVASTDGFSIGDTVTPTGYDATGNAITLVSGCVVSAIPSATALTVSACQLTSDATIDYEYLSGTAANAVAKGLKSAAIVTTGLASTGEKIPSAGKSFLVKGDTTGATVNETLRADIAASSDFNWDDTVDYGVTSNTSNLPIIGGTLSY